MDPDPKRGSPRPARCVHLLPDTHDAGAENQCRYLVAGLGQYEWLAPELAYFGVGRAHSEFEELDLPTLHVARNRRFRFDAYGRARRLRRAYGETPPRILHTWLLEGNIVGLIAARTWPRTRVVITQRGSWNELDYPGLVRLQRLLLGRADHAISNSSGGAEMLARLGMPRDRISVIPNGIPLDRAAVRSDRAAVRARLGWSNRDVIAWVGRVDDAETIAQKDFAGLLAALRTLRQRRPRALLALIGPTRKEIASHGFEVPQWAQALGWHADPMPLVDAADVVAVSSRTEGNSNVVGEALLAGVPVVTTECGDHCSLVRETDGEVTPVGDPDALAGAIAAVLERDSDRKRIRRAAADALSVERMIERTVAVYDRLVA